MFLRRLQRAQARRARLPVLAGLLGATLHSVALRARAGWSRDRLHDFTAGTVALVLSTIAGAPIGKPRG